MNNYLIILSGASRGIGASLRDHLLSCGYQVLGISRHRVDFKHGNYSHLELDLTEHSSFFEIDKYLLSTSIPIYALINNAGCASMNHFLLTSPGKIEQLINLNLISTIRLTQIAAKYMVRRRTGRIINFGTVAVPLGLEGEAVYAATKSAVQSFSKSTAKELGPFNITVNNISPNPIKTALTKTVPKNKLDFLLQSQAIKRFGEFADIANVIDFFLSPRSEFITAQTIYLGGIHD